MELVSVIKNDNTALGSDSAVHRSIVWKHHAEDFNTRSQLIVSEAEDALFVRDGQIVEVFSGGRFSLQTSNYPFLGGLLRRFTGGVSAFHAKVYFVDKSHNLGMYWGTDTPIKLRDPVIRLTTEIQARGGYGFVVTDSKKLMLKLIGNNIQNFDQGTLSGFFRSEFIQEIRAAVGKKILQEGREILEVCAEPGAIAKGVAPILESHVAEYGLRLLSFSIEALDVVTDNAERAKLENAFADRGVLDILGADWGRQQAAETLRDLAANPGLGGMGGASPYGGGADPFSALGAAVVSGREVATPGAGLGQEAQDSAVGRQRQSRFDSAADSAPASPGTKTCGGCGEVSPETANFCGSCGSKFASGNCKNCETELPANARFCSTCGTAAQ